MNSLARLLYRVVTFGSGVTDLLLFNVTVAICTALPGHVCVLCLDVERLLTYTGLGLVVWWQVWDQSQLKSYLNA